MNDKRTVSFMRVTQLIMGLYIFYWQQVLGTAERQLVTGTGGKDHNGMNLGERTNDCFLLAVKY